jgi:hypothetical protein
VGHDPPTLKPHSDWTTKRVPLMEGVTVRRGRQPPCRWPASQVHPESDEVLLISGRVSTPVGGDMDMVVVVPGF